MTLHVNGFTFSQNLNIVILRLNGPPIGFLMSTYNLISTDSLEFKDHKVMKQSKSNLKENIPKSMALAFIKFRFKG